MNHQERKTGGQIVVDCLLCERAEFVFGIPGGQNLGIMDALYDRPEIRFITVHDERAAACMADGYGRVTGKPGVCLATTGPGVTNLLTGVGGALRDSSPVLVLTANNRGGDLFRDDAQEANHVALLQSLCKWSMLVTDGERIPDAMREAFRRAVTGCPGPVHLDFTREILEEQVAASDPLPPERYRASGRTRAGQAEIEAAAKLLLTAEAPTLWTGRGVILSKATDAILKLAEALNIPVITTYNGIGSVPNDHPLVFGPQSRHGTRLTNRVLEGSDLVVAIGNSLNAPSTNRWKLRLPEALIHIDIDPTVIGRHYPFAVGIAADGRAVTDDLQAAVEQNSLSASIAQARQQRIEQLSREKETWHAQVFREEYRRCVPIKPQFLMQVLRQSLPHDAIVVGGAGNPGIWTNLLEIYQPGTYLKPVGFGNMGFALPAAIAAKMAIPDKPVACVIGDGSLGMCISEIETAVREKTPVLIVLMNNRGYGNIKQEQLVHFGPRTIGVDFSDIRFVEIARGFGADGVRVEKPEELSSALENALREGRTFLLEVMIDPGENVWKKPF